MTTASTRYVTRELQHRAPQPTTSSRRRDIRDLRLPPRERRGGRRQRVLAAVQASACEV